MGIAPATAASLDAQRAAGGRLVVVDPRRSATAQRAHLHLQPRPGTDAALDGLHDGANLRTVVEVAK